MQTQTLFTTLASLSAVGALALSGCTSSSTTLDEPAPETQGTDTTASFLACLTSAGVDAKINSSDQVLVKATGGTAAGGVITSEEGALGMEADDQGNSWVVPADASYFSDDPDTQDAYATCEQQYPDFEQPQFDSSNDPAFHEDGREQEEAALVFAQCARTNGYSQIQDPDFSRANALQLPGDLTEADFRDLLGECWDRDTPVFNFGQPIDAPFEAWAVLEEFLNAPTS